ncbi:MAG TPA: UDP-N-acetylmuramoyl-L-alanine--D-glutamate ligase [Candidatus Acidoferrales bacterium]|nr:UDP-N-acetylmuramoyl-L-alanine--D-glutamate ligase [Candidatus Acidoferrales bacterium]
MTALVVGAGRSGAALARHLRARGEAVRLCDLKTEAELGAQLQELPGGVELRLGGYDPGALQGVAAVYASPGVPWDSELLQAARQRGIRVSSEMDLFFRLCPAPIVGITGTNGKTTTTALTGAVLARGPRPVLVGGNIGDTVLDRLPEITPGHWVVLELSSFQLESVEKPRPRIAVVLNLTPDHLDRHRSWEAYVAAKARIVEFQTEKDHALLNSQDASCRELARQTRARVTWFDQHQPAPPMPIPGRHNQENALAAAAVGRLAGLGDPEIAEAMAAFPGVEHRLELVGEFNGVRWYNDSKATNPDAGRVALAAFPGTPLVLIAGGYGGGFELDRWLADVRARAQAVVLMGASAPLLEEKLRGHPHLRRAASLEEAVELAAEAATPGGVVLLSPAYKSFDMFKDFEDRGRRFKAAVRERVRA